MRHNKSLMAVALACAMLGMSSTAAEPTRRRRKDPEPQRGKEPDLIIIDEIPPVETRAIQKGHQLKRPVQSESLRRMLRKVRK